MITATRSVALALMVASAKAGRIVHLYGPPGISKTALAAHLAKVLNRKFVGRRLSQLPQEEVGGVPTTDGNSAYVKRKAMELFKDAIESPSVLLLDEWINAQQSTRGAAIQLLDERCVGDVPLHPECVIVLASNPESQSAGGTAESLPERNRAVRIQLKITAQDWIEWLRAEADAALKLDPNSVWATWARDIAATVDARPGLLQLDPPNGLGATNETWASPRAWHIAIDMLSALDPKDPQYETLINVAICGAVGEEIGAAYLSLRRMRSQICTSVQIVATPESAQLPRSIDAGVAALAIVDEAARVDAAAAFVYAGRLITAPGCEEILMAVDALLRRYGLDKHKLSPHYSEGNKARVAMLGKRNLFANGRV